MRRTKHVIAVMVVATALCADRAIAAAPASNPPAPSFARNFATKLTSNLRRTVAPMRMVSVRTLEKTSTTPEFFREDASDVRTQFILAHFSLPPPTL